MNRHSNEATVRDTMQQEGTVVFVDAASGRFGLRLADGSHALGEQLDARPLALGQSLCGRMDSVGDETLADAGGSASYSVFVLAYGLSREALEQEFR